MKIYLYVGPLINDRKIRCKLFLVCSGLFQGKWEYMNHKLHLIQNLNDT